MAVCWLVFGWSIWNFCCFTKQYVWIVCGCAIDRASIFRFPLWFIRYILTDIGFNCYGCCCSAELSSQNFVFWSLCLFILYQWHLLLLLHFDDDDSVLFCTFFFPSQLSFSVVCVEKIYLLIIIICVTKHG